MRLPRYTLFHLLMAMFIAALYLAAFRAAPGIMVLVTGFAALVLVPAGLLLLCEWALGPVFHSGPRYQRNSNKPSSPGCVDKDDSR